MEPRQVKSAADARAIVETRDLPHVKVGAFDIDGISSELRINGNTSTPAAVSWAISESTMVFSPEGWASRYRLCATTILTELAFRSRLRDSQAHSSRSPERRLPLAGARTTGG